MVKESKLSGSWLIVKAELAGEEMPAFVAEKIQIEFAEENYTVRFSGEISDRGTYSTDETCTPKTLQLSGLAGTNAGRTIPAIYQLVGDRLRVCYGLDGETPTSFKTQPGQNHYLATYRRS